jgi:conserved domain protein
MQMIPVVSSNLEAIGYDSDTQILRVMFKESVYDYFDVPQYEFDNLLNAESKGKYHAAHIKFSYRYKRQ